MPQFDSGSAFGRVLNRILHEGRFTAIEIAIEAKCSDRHVGLVASGKREFSTDKAERVSRYLARHGDTRLAQVFLAPDYTVIRRAEGTADGSVQDELIDIVQALGDFSRGHDARDSARLDAAIATIESCLSDLKAEADALRS